MAKNFYNPITNLWPLSFLDLNSWTRHHWVRKQSPASFYKGLDKNYLHGCDRKHIQKFYYLCLHLLPTLEVMLLNNIFSFSKLNTWLFKYFFFTWIFFCIIICLYSTLNIYKKICKKKNLKLFWSFKMKTNNFLYIFNCKNS